MGGREQRRKLACASVAILLVVLSLVALPEGSESHLFYNHFPFTVNEGYPLANETIINSIENDIPDINLTDVPMWGYVYSIYYFTTTVNVDESDFFIEYHFLVANDTGTVYDSCVIVTMIDDELNGELLYYYPSSSDRNNIIDNYIKYWILDSDEILDIALSYDDMTWLNANNYEISLTLIFNGLTTPVWSVTSYYPCIMDSDSKNELQIESHTGYVGYIEGGECISQVGGCSCCCSYLPFVVLPSTLVFLQVALSRYRERSGRRR